MQSALLDKINEISREIKPSSTYKAKPIQQSNEWINREVFIYEVTTFYHNEITHVRSIIKTIRLLLKPFSIFGYMSLRSYFNLKYKSNFNITKI